MTSKAIKSVIADRQRQIEEEGFTCRHDDKYPEGTLSTAGACYAANAFDRTKKNSGPPFSWPWPKKWWRPKSPRRNLVRAAALIIAEIERFDRQDSGSP